jgi:transposase
MGTSSKERRRYRSWPEALKREIVAASLAPGSSVSLVARRYDVNANQVFAWRRRYRAGSREPAELRLLPVTVTPDQPTEAPPSRASEMLEIELAGGYRIRIGSGVEASALRLVLDVLEQR